MMIDDVMKIKLNGRTKERVGMCRDEECYGGGEGVFQYVVRSEENKK
jgi:hypothetical protein